MIPCHIKLVLDLALFEWLIANCYSKDEMLILVTPNRTRAIAAITTGSDLGVK